MSILKIQHHPCIDEVYWGSTEREGKSDNRTAVENKRMFTKNSPPHVRMSTLNDERKRDIIAQSYDNSKSRSKVRRTFP